MAIYPDPESVIYPTVGPPQFPCRLATRTVARAYPIHEHGVYVNRAGDGATDAVVGHSHQVRGGKVIADPRDGHTHQITNLPCGVW